MARLSALNKANLYANTCVGLRRSGRTTEVARACLARNGLMLFPSRDMADAVGERFPGLRVGSMFGDHQGQRGPVYFDHTCVEVLASCLVGAVDAGPPPMLKPTPASASIGD